MKLQAIAALILAAIVTTAFALPSCNSATPGQADAQASARSAIATTSPESPMARGPRGSAHAHAGHPTAAHAAARPAAVGSPGPIIPASWTIPNWYVDPANSTGCASNSNNCTSATCGGGGVGPCLLVTEITGHRWGTQSPTLAQNTTITVLSPETLNQEHIILTPYVVAGSVFGLIDTPTLEGTFTLGVVTPKNRATAQLLTSTGFAVGNPGDLVVNATHPSNARIYQIAAGTATLTQPLAPITIADASDFPSAMPAEVDTWATGDSVIVYSLPLLNIDHLVGEGGQTVPSTIGGTSWVQNVLIPDNTGSPGNSYFAIGQPSSTTVAWFVNSTVEPFAIVQGPTAGGVDGSFDVNDWFAGGLSISDGSMVGGACVLFGCGVYQFAAIDGDAIASSGLNNGMNMYEQGFLGLVYAANGVSLFNGARGKLDPIWYPSTILWGLGAINVQDTSSMEKVTGATWVASMLLPSMTIDGSGTGTSYSAGVWTDGVAVTTANIDANAGLQNPRTGAKYCNTQ